MKRVLLGIGSVGKRVRRFLTVVADRHNTSWASSSPVRHPPPETSAACAGADATCQRLATAVGAGNRTWRAYLSAARDNTNNNLPAHARDRIGLGPWHNANGVLVAGNLGELHARTGDAALLVDERGQRINGQWTGSPTPVQHDILTGSNADGSLMSGFTCADWTSSATADVAQVGHSDGMGPGQSTAGTLASWNSAHANQNCADTAPRGGSGRFYCFAR